jgi:uncharacterized protein GlcG (DUF336 family)
MFRLSRVVAALIVLVSQIPIANGQTPTAQAAASQSLTQVAPGLVRTDVVTVRALTMQYSMKAAQAVLEECRAANPNVAVVVVDSNGNPRLIMVADGAKASLVDNARRKGLTAATLHQVTSVEQKMVAANPLLVIPPNAQDLIEPGGVPIRAGTVVIGGIGVEGGDPMEAEKCAQAGVDKLKNDLHPEFPAARSQPNGLPAGGR